MHFKQHSLNYLQNKTYHFVDINKNSKLNNKINQILKKCTRIFVWNSNCFVSSCNFVRSNASLAYLDASSSLADLAALSNAAESNRYVPALPSSCPPLSSVQKQCYNEQLLMTHNNLRVMIHFSSV